MLYALLITAVVIFVAEQGDKTQVLAMALATRYRAWQVLLGIFFVNVAVLFVFTLAGRLIGGLLPGFWLWILSGVAFLAFGVVSLVTKPEEVKDVDSGRFGVYGPVLATAGLFFLAEIGDSAEIITAAIAANSAGPLGALAALGGVGAALSQALARVGVGHTAASPLATFLGVWFGAVIGIMLADAIAVAVGRWLGRRMPELLLRRITGVLFVAGGVAILGVALAGKL